MTLTLLWTALALAGPYDDCQVRQRAQGDIRVECPAWRASVMPAQPGTGEAVLELMAQQMSGTAEVTRATGKHGPMLHFRVNGGPDGAVEVVPAGAGRSQVLICEASPAECVGVFDTLLAHAPVPTVVEGTVADATVVVPAGCETRAMGKVGCDDGIILSWRHLGPSDPDFETLAAAMVKGFGEQGTVAEKAAPDCLVGGRPGSCRVLEITRPQGMATVLMGERRNGQKRLFGQCNVPGPLPDPLAPGCAALFSLN